MQWLAGKPFGWRILIASFALGVAGAAPLLLYAS
jgi:hypothetical protein